MVYNPATRLKGLVSSFDPIVENLKDQSDVIGKNQKRYSDLGEENQRNRTAYDNMVARYMIAKYQADRNQKAATSAAKGQVVGAIITVVATLF